MVVVVVDGGGGWVEQLEQVGLSGQHGHAVGGGSGSGLGLDGGFGEGGVVHALGQRCGVPLADQGQVVDPGRWRRCGGGIGLGGGVHVSADDVRDGGAQVAAA